MGAIQNSFNQALGAVGGAALGIKHAVDLSEANEIAKKELQMKENREALDIRQEAGDLETEMSKQYDLEEERDEARKNKELYREGTYDETGKVIRNRITGRFVSLDDVEHDKTLLGLEDAESTAQEIAMEHANMITKRKEKLQLRIQQAKVRTGKDIPSVREILKKGESK